MIAPAGPAAEALIIASHCRLLGYLEARDADAAARRCKITWHSWDRPARGRCTPR
jgi:hypothetical protein